VRLITRSGSRRDCHHDDARVEPIVSTTVVGFAVTLAACASRHVDTSVKRAVTHNCADASPFHGPLGTGIIARAPWRPVRPSKVPFPGNGW
jgi:hypothetical protein